MSDALWDGPRFRTFSVVDDFNREALAIAIDFSLTAERVVRELERIAAHRGYPLKLRLDNGSEFISKVLDKWAYENEVTLDFSRPGKPTDNPFIESFNGSFRDECLNVNWFLSLDDAKEKIEAFKDDYNGFRPHSALCGLTPNQVVAGHHQTRNFLL